MLSFAYRVPDAESYTIASDVIKTSSTSTLTFPLADAEDVNLLNVISSACNVKSSYVTLASPLAKISLLSSEYVIASFELIFSSQCAHTVTVQKIMTIASFLNAIPNNTRKQIAL